MKKIIKTDKAPMPIGPYNQAVMTDNLLFISGQIPVNPATNTIVNDSIENATLQVMKNLEAILAEAGMTFEHVVKSSIFLIDMHEFSKVNTIYGQFFNPENAPARETVQVAKLPLGVPVEISMVASF